MTVSPVLDTTETLLDGFSRSWRWSVAVGVSDRDLAAGTLRALGKLGYEIALPPDGPDVGHNGGPDLWVVDDLNRVVREPGTASSLIVLVTKEATPGSSNLQVVALLPPPVGLQELYVTLQEVLEMTPRSAPRISTSLSAHCRAGNRFWPGEILGLCETGCLFRSSRGTPTVPEVRLGFELPSGETVSTRARTAHRGPQNAGFAFEDLPPASRSSISQYVMGRLTA